MKSQKTRENINSIFPDWHTANIILAEIIDKHVNVHVAVDTKKDPTAVVVWLLDQNALYLIPEEDRKRFIAIFREFTNNLFEEINIKEKFSRLPVSQVSFNSIKSDIKKAIANWEYQNNTTLQTELRKIFLLQSNIINSVNITFQHDTRTDKRCAT